MLPANNRWMTEVSRIQSSVRVILWRGRFIATAGALLCLVAGIIYIGPALLPEPFPAAIMSMLACLLAHCFRAMRLSIIAGALLKIPARTTFLLHFATVPFAIIPPFKAGEIVRLYNLWLVGRNLSESIVTVVLDRLFDAIMLIFVLGWLVLNGHIVGSMSSVGNSIQGMIIAVTITAGICFLIGPRALSGLQRYVVIHHTGRDTLVSLRFIDVLRKGTTDGEKLLRQQGAVLMMITVLIWGVELSAAALLTHLAVLRDFHDAGVLLINRATQEWQAAISTNIDPALAVSAAGNILVVLAVWPFAVLGYLSRIVAPVPRSRRARQQARRSHRAV